MRTLDPRISELHIARYGATDTERYLSVINNIPALPDDKRGENHHLLAASTWPEYKNLKANPWNRLRVSHAVHAALTELQSEFEARLRHAALLMKGQSVEAAFFAQSKAGKKGGKRNAERDPGLMRIKTFDSLSKGGKHGSKVANCLQWRIRRGQSCICGTHSEIQLVEIPIRINVMTSVLRATLRSRRKQTAGRIGGKVTGRMNVESGHLESLRTPEHQRMAGMIANCLRWNIRRGKPCTCGKH
jgi:hypothetical protein